jgi:hypothetical protein
MATFNNMIVTNGGKVIYSKAISGKSITFTKAEFGSGIPASQSDAAALGALVDSKIIGAIESIDTTTTAGVAIITVQVNNSALTEALGIREVGIFCKDPDTNADVLYSYMYAPTDIDVIPSNANGVVVWKMRIQLAISNATGEATEQSSLVSFTPVLSAVSADGLTVFISEIIAKCSYRVNGKLVTAFYNITGKLSNMLTAENGLERLTIGLPKVSAVKRNLTTPMTITITDDHSLIYPAGSVILVDILGRIEENSDVIDIDYFGFQSGDFTLDFEITYEGV